MTKSENQWATMLMTSSPMKNCTHGDGAQKEQVVKQVVTLLETCEVKLLETCEVKLLETCEVKLLETCEVKLLETCQFRTVRQHT